jgi:hypothetical protein
MLEHLLPLLKEHWPKLAGLALGFIPVLWGIYRARREWRKREFMSRFSISLNVLRPDHNGTALWIPAAGEYNLEEVFHRNRLAVRIVRKAAYAATPEEPFLVTIPEDDRASILNEVANRVEVMLREGSFAALAGLPVRFVPLVLGLTCEKGADVRIRKVRAMVVEESLLRGVDQLAEVRLDKPHHVVRVQTLRHMAKLYADEPDFFVRLVVALRIPEATAVRSADSSHLVSASRLQAPSEGGSPARSAPGHGGQTRPDEARQQAGQATDGCSSLGGAPA